MPQEGTHGGTDHCHVAPSGEWREGGGNLPEDRDQRGDVLQLEEAVCRVGDHGAARAAAIARREWSAEASGSGFVAGPADLAGDRLKKAVRPRTRRKVAGWVQEELRLALEGRVREHHRFLLRELLDHWEVLTVKISRLEEEIQRRMHASDEKAGIWQTIPGIDQVTAWSLVAEMGVNMEQSTTGRHLASWAGLCPGNNESAGKRK